VELLRRKVLHSDNRELLTLAEVSTVTTSPRRSSGHVPCQCDKETMDSWSGRPHAHSAKVPSYFSMAASDGEGGCCSIF